MNQLNSLILEGYIAKDAVLFEPVENFKVCKFSIGVNRNLRNRNNQEFSEVSFFNVEVYGKTAELCTQRCKKGRGVRIVGRLKQDFWKDKEGKSQSKVFVVAEHIEYMPVSTKKAEATAPIKEADAPAINNTENIPCIF